MKIEVRKYNAAHHVPNQCGYIGCSIELRNGEDYSYQINETWFGVCKGHVYSIVKGMTKYEADRYAGIWEG